MHVGDFPGKPPFLWLHSFNKSLQLKHYVSSVTKATSELQNA